jgi:NAD(P)-dependent dehydrogenase (short-subunit alcohol dehydrogenase family)/acyl carrier protein
MRRRGVRCTAAATLEPSHAANELDAVVMLAEPDSSADPAAAAVAITERAVSLIADVKKATGTPRIWFVTRGVHDSGSAAGLATAPLWGIARTLALEEPRLWGGIVDLGDRATVDEADRLADELLVRGADDQVAYRDGVRMVPRLRPVRAERGGRFAARSGDTYLITGGLGALGLATAEFLVARGARHLCLVGRRRVASESARRSVEGLRRAGAEVSVHAADVTNVAEIGSVIDAVNRSGHALGGVVHAAGVTGYRALAETSRDEMTAILAPKIQGAWALHQLTASADVQFFMCYSSMVSVWGARGQGPYAAANHFLDALAHVRRAQGLPATTVNWGPLTGGGMVPEDVVRELQRMGVSSTPLESAVDALDDVLTGDQVQPIVVAIDWSRFGELYRTRSRSGIFNLLSAAASPPAATGAPAGRSEVLSALSGERRGVVIGVLRQLLTHVIRDVERLDTTTGLFAMGMDSLGAMEFRRLIEQQLGVSIPSTLLFDCGTLEVLADAVLARMLPAAGVAVSAAVDAIDGLSEIELEALLRRKLDEVG